MSLGCYYGVFINQSNKYHSYRAYSGHSGLEPHPILPTTLRGRPYYLHFSEEEIGTPCEMAFNEMDFRTSPAFQKVSAAVGL